MNRRFYNPKKVKFLDMKITNHSVNDMEKKVMELFRVVRTLGEEKIDVKIDFFAKKPVGEDDFDI
jgi:hypothetical protein